MQATAMEEAMAVMVMEEVVTEDMVDTDMEEVTEVMADMAMAVTEEVMEGMVMAVKKIPNEM